MNGARNSAIQLADEIVRVLQGEETLAAEVVLCPSFLHIPLVADILADCETARLGAQNCSEFDDGAYTGEVSADMIREFGCEYVIIGHSERRQFFTEDSERIAKKFQRVQKAGMTPILCIGEQKADREAGGTQRVIKAQLLDVVETLGIKAFSKAVLAYEPVWAIGTGLTATPDQAEEVHAFIRETLSALDGDIANELTILYGGSVKPDNAGELFNMPNIDGGLIGGASLKAEDFLSICKAVG